MNLKHRYKIKKQNKKASKHRAPFRIRVDMHSNSFSRTTYCVHANWSFIKGSSIIFKHCTKSTKRTLLGHAQPTQNVYSNHVELTRQKCNHLKMNRNCYTKGFFADFCVQFKEIWWWFWEIYTYMYMLIKKCTVKCWFSNPIPRVYSLYTLENGWQ